MTTSLATEVSPSVTPNAAQPSGSKKDSEGGMSFGDILDVINPLQHIPIISTLYRELTGDTISPAARVAGDALYGGLIGLGSSIVNEVVEGTTGKDIGGHIWATLFGDDSDDAAKSVQAAPVTNAPAPEMISSASEPVAPTVPIPPADGSVTPLNGPTSFFQGLQHPAHLSHGVPLNATVSTGDAQKTVNANEAILKAQQNLNGQGQTPAANLGTTGLSPAAAPPAPIAAAPPLSPPTAIVPPNISELMMSALDKYKAMAVQQGDNGKPAAAPVGAVPTS